MDEHHWKYRPSTHCEGIAQDFEQKLKATTETPAPSICVLRDGVWCHVVGPWVAEEMLRLSMQQPAPEPAVDGEHRWKFKVGSNRYDQYRAIIKDGVPCIQVLQSYTWVHWTGEPVAAEMFRLATENEELRAELSRFYNDAIEASHDLSVKLELAETRVKELEAREAVAPHPLWETPLDLL